MLLIFKFFKHIFQLFLWWLLTFRACLRIGSCYCLWVVIFLILVLFSILFFVIFIIEWILFILIIIIRKYSLLHKLGRSHFLISSNCWQLINQLPFLLFGHFLFKVQHGSKLINHLLYLKIQVIEFTMSNHSVFMIDIGLQIMYSILKLNFLFVLLFGRLFRFRISKRTCYGFENRFHIVLVDKLICRNE